MDMEQEVETKGSDIKEKFNRGAEAAKKFASQAKDTAKEYASKAKTATEGQIKDNPLWSMLIAIGVGMTLGMLVSAAFSSKRDYE